MSVNNEECWSQRFGYFKGSQECGDKISMYSYDASAAAECEAEAVGGKLTVRVYTDLDSNGKDESFAIDNVTITAISARASHVSVNMVVVGFAMVGLLILIS